jgi:hypothetical protein
VIAADGRARHAQVVKVIDLLRQENVTRFAINVETRGPEAMNDGPHRALAGSLREPPASALHAARVRVGRRRAREGGRPPRW